MSGKGNSFLLWVLLTPSGSWPCAAVLSVEQVWFASRDGLGRELLSSLSAGNHRGGEEEEEEEEDRLLAGGEGLWLSGWPCRPSQQPLLRAS